MEIEITLAGIFHIDNHAKTSTEMQPPSGSDSLRTYVQNISHQLLSGTQHKAFKFSQQNRVFHDAANTVWQNGLTSEFLRIANQLASAEGNSPQRSRIPIGSLVIANGTMGQQKFFIVAKIDRSDFLNETSFDFESGLPVDKIIFKACLITSVTGAFPSKAFVYDSVTAAYAKYWWSDFLGLEEERTSEENTKRAFNAIDEIIKKQLEPFRVDYLNIRNSLVHFFRVQREFALERLLDTVIGNYQISDQNLPPERIEILRNHIRQSPDRKLFDTGFQIAFGVIKAKIKKAIALRPELDLIIKGDYPPDAIKSERFEGHKCVIIRSETGYDSFNIATERNGN